MVTRALGSKRVVVGPSLVRLGMASLEAALRSDRPHQVLVTLANRLGEHCQIGRRFDDAVIYVDSAKALRSDGLYFEQGGRAPLYCTSIGKLFLADMSDADLDWWLAHANLERLTPSTIVAANSLRALVKKVRREDWAVSNQEFVIGVVGCAVPIKSSTGRLIAGLGISAPSARVPFEQLSKFRSLMESSAAEIATALSYDD
jgi:DNA-binding IclR family transcriptional regulator